MKANDYMDIYFNTKRLLLDPIGKHSDKENSKILKVIQKLSYKSAELMKFLKTNKNKVLEQLKDYVNDYDDSMV